MLDVSRGTSSLSGKNAGMPITHTDPITAPIGDAIPPMTTIATSRSENDGWTGRALSRIVPRPIALDRLQSFFVAYLNARGQGEVLRDDELVPAQNQLCRIVGDKPITALLAQMFIDDVIAKRSWKASCELMPSICW